MVKIKKIINFRQKTAFFDIKMVYKVGKFWKEGGF